MAGYGTQYALDELDEGERIVDAPIPGTLQVNANPTVTKQDATRTPEMQYKLAATQFLNECKRILGPETVPQDAKAVYRRMFGSETMTIENLRTALIRMNEYADNEADRFAAELLGEDE
jgi:hypothetical protein